MSFEVYGSEQKDGSSREKVDFNALNKYVVETAGLQERETLIGYVSMIVDLGTQEQPDAEMTFTGNEDDEREEVAKYPNTYFKNGFDQQTKKNVRLKCWPQKPIQCVAIAVDFPDILIDKGKFFGDSKPLPLRLWLGDQFYIPDTGMVIARPTPLKVNKKLGDWSFDQKHLLYKMAVADKLIKPGEVFVPKSIDKLLGKSFQFEAQVFFKKGKDGKDYYTEYVKFVSGLGRGQKAPSDIGKPMLIQMNRENDEQAVKEVRAHVLNTCRRAFNWEGSVLQQQVDSIRGKREDSSKDKQEAPVQQTTPDPDPYNGTGDFDDESLPF